MKTETRTVYTSRSYWLRLDTGKKTTAAYAAAHPDRVVTQYETVASEEKFND